MTNGSRKMNLSTPLLGTPHGSGVAWILINHRNILAGKAVLSVQTFTMGSDYQMLVNTAYWQNENLPHHTHSDR